LTRETAARVLAVREAITMIRHLGSTANGHINGQVLSVAGGRELVR
jgi:hypothetical protein